MGEDRAKETLLRLIQSNGATPCASSERVRQRIHGSPDGDRIEGRNAREDPGVLGLIQECVNGRTLALCGTLGSTQAVNARPELTREDLNLEDPEPTNGAAWMDTAVNPLGRHGLP